MIKNILWIFLTGMAVGLKIFSVFPDAVEKYYSTGAYPVISRFLRMMFGWLPFSLGDILYATVVLILLSAIVSLFKNVINKRITRASLISSLKNFIAMMLWIYILFNILWGLNYNRKGIAYQLNLKVKEYSTADLNAVVKIIVDRLNALDTPSRLYRDELSSKHILFSQSLNAYQQLEKQNSIFRYVWPSIKPSLFSYVGDYLGFTGYYNPFSGEAQVNTTIPAFVQPYTTCHEIAHQLGYAKENEANFAGYLSAKASVNPAFQYSAYFDLYLYAAKELYIRDSSLLVPLRENLHPAVRKDFRDLQLFYKRYENPLEPVITRLYGNYLKINQQPQGMMTYNEVIAWLIAYYKKFGESAI